MTAAQPSAPKGRQGATIRTTGTSFPTVMFGTAGTASVRCNDLNGAQRWNDLNGLNLTFNL
jgi:hypothetical protein